MSGYVSITTAPLFLQKFASLEASTHESMVQVKFNVRFCAIISFDIEPSRVERPLSSLDKSDSCQVQPVGELISIPFILNIQSTSITPIFSLTNLNNFSFYKLAIKICIVYILRFFAIEQIIYFLQHSNNP